MILKLTDKISQTNFNKYCLKTDFFLNVCGKCRLFTNSDSNAQNSNYAFVQTLRKS